MHLSRLAQLALLSSLTWVPALRVARAQPADAGTAPAVPVAAPTSGASGAPALGQPPAPTAPPAAPNQGFEPAQSPLVPQPPANAGYPQPAPVYPQAYGAPQYGAPQPAQEPGYYGNYAPGTGYPAPQAYPEQERVAGPGFHKHDGFFLRFKIGIGAGGTSYEERIVEPRTSDVKTRGLAGNFELSIGGSVIENLALHGSMVVTVVGANKKVDDVDDNSYDRISTSLFIIGGGATYYFMPTNLYLTLVLGAGGVIESRYIDGDRNEDPADEIASGTGFGSSLSLGKEWWVGRTGEWGLGAAITGAFVVAPVRIGDLSTHFIGDSVSLNFSSTFN